MEVHGNQHIVLSGTRSNTMKSRALTMLATLVVLALVAAPAMFAQTQQTTPSQPQATAPQTPPAATPQDSSAPQTPAATTQDEGPSPYPEDQPGAKKPKEDKKEKHDGGKNDIDAIGNRDIGSGKKGLGNWYSLESEIKMG
jgi:hypothetical protein